ncbi:hypothetical protein CROQUDRAFT_108310 [Cronartium quercuum f. sp. fusiforme G11]|uniref:Secreted protein n=1 Tax=Cronartium quercuum f. sp. fusiforme G11 TaxID=708437 RepID=A0A9P6NJP5_9BASI|nr:hypothetical protein CROQUDRAFT_108310 [Cronartium quercuum f. sp. fusiforme G11]
MLIIIYCLLAIGFVIGNPTIDDSWQLDCGQEWEVKGSIAFCKTYHDYTGKGSKVESWNCPLRWCNMPNPDNSLGPRADLVGGKLNLSMCTEAGPTNGPQVTITTSHFKNIDYWSKAPWGELAPHRDAWVAKTNLSHTHGHDTTLYWCDINTPGPDQWLVSVYPRCVKANCTRLD